MPQHGETGELPDADDVLRSLTFDERGLIPAIIQDVSSHEVLMLAWMNSDSIRASLTEQRTVFWSRSRKELWRKGETSGHVQRIVEFRADCDADALLVVVEQTGPACHTGAQSCFHVDQVEGSESA